MATQTLLSLMTPAKVSGTVPTNEKTVQYLVCNDTAKNVGFQVTWYNAVDGSTQVINGGTATGSTAAGAVTCDAAGV